MSSWIRLVSGVGFVWLAVVLNGCLPTGQGQSDEENEPHFVLGKNRVNTMDYQGAIEAFEESLEVNPHSAAAHFELAWLYDEKEPDPAAAIYHYQEYLKFDPSADNADVIKQRIYRCKQQLATDVLPLPSAPAAQAQLEGLAEQNRQLQDEVDKWRAYYASQMAAAKTNSSPAQSISEQTRVVKYSVNPTTASRTHTVARGETAMGLSHKFRIKLNDLQAANPGVNLGRIRVGQVLNIPSS
jgi:tetratricopeptide (TPR) repeat protein